MVKYNGKNTSDNEIEIDFEQKEVNFNPVNIYTNSEIMKYLLFNFCFLFLFLQGVIILIIELYLSSSQFLQDSTHKFIFFIYNTTFFSIFFLLFLFISLFLAYNKKFLEDYWPVLNTYFAIFSEILSFNFLISSAGIRWITYKPFNVRNINNLYFIDIPKFKNVSIDYELYGDFSKYIKKIDIYAIDKETLPKPKRWVCLFIFKQLPLSGRMRVRYI